MIKRKIVLRFIVGADENNNYRYKNVTLRNIRPELNDDQLCEFVIRYCSLTANVLDEAVVVDERRLIIQEDTELIEEELLLEEDDTSRMKEGGNFSEKREVTASNHFKEAQLTTPKAEIKALTQLERLMKQEQQLPSARSLAPLNKKEVAWNVLTPKQNLLEPKSNKIISSVAKNQQQSGIQQQSQTSGSNQALLAEAAQENILVNKDLIVKEQMPVDIKKQSPPLTDHQDDFKPEVSPAGLSHKKGFVEEEIEIWLDDDQDQSVAAVMALIQEALEPKNGGKQPASFKRTAKQGHSLPSIEISCSYHEDNADEPNAHGHPYPLVSLVKKKRIQPPVGRRTKTSKKKRR